MNEQREVIRAQLSCGVDYYKGEKGDKPVKGVDYFTQEDIDSIIEQIEAGDIDLTSYATKEYVNDKIDDIVETDPTVPEWAKQENKPTYTAAEVGALPADTVIPTVPTNVSAFTNDAGYLTSHQSLDNYATKSYVEQVVAGIETGALKRSIVSTLPTTEIDENTIYMVANSGSGNDVYDEYLYVNNKWEKIGSSAVDLTDYATKNYVDTAVGNIPAYTLPTASTSTLGGVKVDGSTITITDGVISATSSGGGSGIGLDKIGAINLLPWLTQNGASMWRTTLPTLAESLNTYGYAIVDASALYNFSMSDLNNALGGTNYTGHLTTFTATDANPVGISNYSATSTDSLFSRNARDLYYFVLSADNVYFSNGSSALWRTFGYFLAQNIGLSTAGASNYTSPTLLTAIKQLDAAISNKQDAIIPTAPSTDGTYFLTTTITSGTPAYSWENVVIGGSY